MKNTGTSFHILSVGLFAGIVLNIIQHHKPETTLWGMYLRRSWSESAESMILE